MKKLHVAFAGFRHGHILSLYEALGKRDDVVITGAWEADGAARQQAAAKGVAFGYESLTALLDDPAVEAVAIGDYYAARGALALAALRAGKHVLADKPLCTARDELDAIRAEAAKRHLAVGMLLDLRDDPTTYRALCAIRQGALGRVNNISFEGQHPLLYGSRPGWYFEEGKYGGVINDIAIHGIDLAREMTGSAVEQVVGARTWHFYADQVPHFQDSAQLVLRMGSGAGVMGDVSYAAPNAFGYRLPCYWQFRVWGEKGMMTWSYGSESVLFYAAASGEVQKLPPLTPPTTVVDRFVAAVREGDAAYSQATCDVARDTLWVQQQAEEKP